MYSEYWYASEPRNFDAAARVESALELEMRVQETARRMRGIRAGYKNRIDVSVMVPPGVPVIVDVVFPDGTVGSSDMVFGTVRNSHLADTSARGEQDQEAVWRTSPRVHASHVEYYEIEDDGAIAPQLEAVTENEVENEEPSDTQREDEKDNPTPQTETGASTTPVTVTAVEEGTSVSSEMDLHPADADEGNANKTADEAAVIKPRRYANKIIGLYCNGSREAKPTAKEEVAASPVTESQLGMNASRKQSKWSKSLLRVKRVKPKAGTVIEPQDIESPVSPTTQESQQLTGMDIHGSVQQAASPESQLKQDCTQSDIATQTDKLPSVLATWLTAQEVEWPFNIPESRSPDVDSEKNSPKPQLSKSSSPKPIHDNTQRVRVSPIRQSRHAATGLNLGRRSQSNSVKTFPSSPVHSPTYRRYVDRELEAIVSSSQARLDYIARQSRSPTAIDMRPSGGLSPSMDTVVRSPSPNSEPPILSYISGYPDTGTAARQRAGLAFS